jgi:hypothetical protein
LCLTPLINGREQGIGLLAELAATRLLTGQGGHELLLSLNGLAIPQLIE